MYHKFFYQEDGRKSSLITWYKVGISEQT